MPAAKAPAKKAARPSAKAEAARIQEIFDRFAANEDHPKTELNYSDPFTLVVAVDALGADRVYSVSMPSRYTSQMSKDDAALQARWLGVEHSEISIEGMFEATLAALKDEFAGRAPESRTARCQF